MSDMTNAAPVAVNSPGLPDDQRRLIELDDAIAKIRTQIATADLARQRGQKPIDPGLLRRRGPCLHGLNPMPSLGVAEVLTRRRKDER